MDCIAEVVVPLHVTGLWLPVREHGLTWSGSLGAGLLLEPPAVARVERCGRGTGRCGVRVVAEGRVLDGEPSVVLELYRLEPAASRLRVTVELPVPLGVGYAASAAVALGVAVGYAVAAGMTIEEGARLAHMAEVAAGTGLGDVVAMTYGRGLELRLGHGAPGAARVESVAAWGPVVAAETGAPLSTEEMHRGLGERLHALAAPRLARLFQSPGLDSFLREAREFSLEAGFVDEELARRLDGLVEAGLARGWYAKKRVLVVVAAGEEAQAGVTEALREAGLRPRAMRIAAAPLRVRPCGAKG